MFSKAFRLFVSSTFQDFGEERRLLQERVFPALEAHCAREGFDFRAVDMRWGINDDAQLDQRTSEICLGEVMAAKGYPAPNLLILIGDRYGWVPLPFAIARDEFEAARDWLIARGKRRAVSDLDAVYGLDENHLVVSAFRDRDLEKPAIAAYTLRSREDELAKYKRPKAWMPIEKRLRTALQAAAEHLYASGVLDESGRAKYFRSLTEQEIHRGLDHLASGAGAASAIAWVRTTKKSEQTTRNLLEEVQRSLPSGNVLWAQSSANRESYAQDFVCRIKTQLIAAIDVQIARMRAHTQGPDFALETERAAHAAFAAERLRVFVGRSSNLAGIAAHVAGHANHPLVLSGPSGAGKTALMAKAAKNAKDQHGDTVVQRFVGASAGSASQRSLLISVIEDLAALRVATLPKQWEDDDNRFVAQVRDILVRLDQPVAIFIDALDQLRAPYRPMWLPPQLNPRVKLIVSVLDDEAFAAERAIVEGLHCSLPADAFLAIEPLRKEDGAEILAGLKREAQRGLSPDQEAFILERFQAAGASPLYLRIAFAIASRWRSGDDPRARGLAGEVTALVGQFFDDLSSVHHHEPLLVRRAVGLIAASREGLSEREVIAVLSREADVMAAVSSARFGAMTDRLPDSVWVRLKRSLATLLVEKGEEGEPLITFFHRQVTEVVRERFYEQQKVSLHASLAAYFDRPAKISERDATYSRRGLIELPFQLFHSGDRHRLDLLLTDAGFIAGKIDALGGANDIVEDYTLFGNPEDSLQPLIRASLRLTAGTIARDPKQAILQLHGRLISKGELLKSRRFLEDLLDRAPEGALFETRPAMTSPGAEVARLEGHEFPGRVTALITLHDGRVVSGGDDRTIRVWDPIKAVELACITGCQGWIGALSAVTDGRLASAGSDHTIKLWDLQNGCELVRLEGHRDWITALATLPGGRLVSGSIDGSIRVWDIGSAREMARLPGFGPVRAIVVLPDDTMAIAGGDGVWLWAFSAMGEPRRVGELPCECAALAVLGDGRLAGAASDKTIRVWDAQSAREISRMEAHVEVNALTALPNGLLAGATDATIRLWDADNGREVGRLQGHQRSINALAALSDGHLVSAGDERTILVWQPQKSAANIGDLSHRVSALAVMPDGRIASGSSDGCISLWDGRDADRSERLGRHGDYVRALVALPDGRLASAGDDKIIRMWDPSSGREIARLEGHESWVQTLSLLPDGRMASGTGLGDSTVIVWDIEGLREIVRLEVHKPINSLAGLVDGRIAVGADDANVRLWDPKVGGMRASRLTGEHELLVRAIVTFSDGCLAIGLDDGTIRIWDPSRAIEVACLSAHSLGVRALAGITKLVTMPGGRLASAGNDKTIRIWDSDHKRELARLEVDARVTALAAMSDGRLVAGDALGRLHWLAIKGWHKTTWG